jgi:hypothetical protein
MTVYYICDNCGSVADISEEPHPPTPLWVCGDCESTAVWEFTDKDKALLHSRHIQDKRFAAQMAGLDQARAALDEAPDRKAQS